MSRDCVTSPISICVSNPSSSLRHPIFLCFVRARLITTHMSHARSHAKSHTKSPAPNAASSCNKDVTKTGKSSLPDSSAFVYFLRCAAQFVAVMPT